MKGRFNKKKILFIVLFLLTTLLAISIFWQYRRFTRSFKLSDLVVDELTFGNPRIINQVNTKNLPIMFNYFDDINISNIKISSDSADRYELILTNDREYLGDYVKNSYINSGYDHAKALEAVQGLPETKYIIVKKTSTAPYVDGEMFTLTFSYKSWNIFNFLCPPRKVKINYKVDAVPTSGMEDDYLDGKLSSYTGGLIPKESLIEIEEIDINCPTRAIKYTTYQIKEFTVSDVDCLFARGEADLGEDVTVEIYTSNFEQGKQAFRDWLAENGLQESDKLRVEYVHVPK